jgi:long-subunit fatty acid transport protein
MRKSLHSVIARSSGLVVLLAAAKGFAGGYFIPNTNARDLGLAQATVASQTGPEATYQNPSALAGQQGLAATVSVGDIYNQTSWSDPTLGHAGIDSKVDIPEAASVSYGAKLGNGMGYGFGLGFLEPAGGSLNWPSGWPGNQQIVGVSQRIYLTQAAGAFQPLPYLKLGAALDYYRGTLDLSQKIGFISSQGSADLALAGGAFSFSAAGQFDAPWIPLTIAVNYLHKADIGYSGNVHFEGIPPTFQTLLHDQSVTLAQSIPNDLFIGAAYKITPDLQVMGSWNLERWSVYRQDQFIGADGFRATVPRDYHNAYVFRLAGEWNVCWARWLTVRGGLLRSISAQPANTISPTLSDGDSWAFTLGAGFQIIPSLRADVGYWHSWFNRSTASGVANGIPAFPGTYNTRVDVFSVGLTFRPDWPKS